MLPLAMAGGASDRNPAAPAAGSAEEECGEELGSARGRFELELKVRRPAASSAGEAGQRRSQERLLRRALGRGGKWGGAHGSTGS
jgi:hypothetical protein